MLTFAVFVAVLAPVSAVAVSPATTARGGDRIRRAWTAIVGSLRVSRRSAAPIRANRVVFAGRTQAIDTRPLGPVSAQFEGVATFAGGKTAVGYQTDMFGRQVGHLLDGDLKPMGSGWLDLRERGGALVGTRQWSRGGVFLVDPGTGRPLSRGYAEIGLTADGKLAGRQGSFVAILDPTTGRELERRLDVRPLQP